MDFLPDPIAKAIEGTPLAENELELGRLSEYPWQDQAMIVSVIKGGDADTVEGAVQSIRANLERVKAERDGTRDGER